MKAKNDVPEYLKEISNLKEDKAKLLRGNHDLEVKITSCIEQLRALETSLSIVKEKLQQSTLEVGKLNEEKKQSGATISQLKKERAGLKAAIKKLKENESSLLTSSTGGGGLDVTPGGNELNKNDSEIKSNEEIEGSLMKKPTENLENEMGETKRKMSSVLISISSRSNSMERIVKDEVEEAGGGKVPFNNKIETSSPEKPRRPSLSMTVSPRSSIKGTDIGTVSPSTTEPLRMDGHKFYLIEQRYSEPILHSVRSLNTTVFPLRFDSRIATDAEGGSRYIFIFK